VGIFHGALGLAVGLLWLEAAGMALLAGLEIYDVFTVEAENTGWALTLGAMLICLTVLLAWLGRLLSRRRAGARNPAVALHLLAFPVGYLMITGGLVLLGALALAICLTGVALLVVPSTTKELGIG
jgi:hypothetical protein